MDYCNSDGARIPHSVFLRWSEADRDKALAWFVRDRSRCPGCHVAPGEGDGLMLEEYLCPTCERLEQPGAAENKGFRGMRRRLVPIPTGEAP